MTERPAVRISIETDTAGETRKTYRGAGIGRRLLEAAEAEARKSGCLQFLLRKTFAA